MLRELTARIAQGDNLSMEEAEASLNQVFSNDVSDVAIAAILTALKTKGETPEEIAGFARGMRSYSLKILCPGKGLIDTAGTGGGNSSFNISTTATFVIAAAGFTVAKHGNRAATSKSGSADLLEALGVKLAAGAENIRRCLDEIKLGFLFAPMHHPAMKRVAGIRKELAFKTVFNMLGPLTNPADAEYQLIGAFSRETAEKMAKALALLGSRRAWVLHSRDGMDEISPFAPTDIFEVNGNQVRYLEFDPRKYGFSNTSGELMGGTPSENAEITRAILGGKLEGAEKDVVLLNSAAAIALTGMEMKEALFLAREALESGAALDKMNELKEITNG